MTQGSTVTTYQYDANNNRLKMTKTGVGTTTYTYDAADVTLVSKTDPNGKVTTYSYDLVNGKSNGNLVQTVYDPGGTGHLNQTTTSTYDTNNRLNTVQLPSGTLVTFTYDAEGHRVSKTVINGSTTVIQDVSALGHLAYQTDGAGNKLATFTYDANGVPSSVVIGSGTSTPRYYYVYNGHGDVVALVDSVGTVVASYSYDAFGNLTSSSETLPNGWTNPYRYDGAEGVRYDVETGLCWLSVRAYDPSLGRFLSHDPLGRLAAWGVDFQPYVYASNNPVVNTDPTGLISCPIRIDGQCQSYWSKVSGVTNPPKPPLPPPGCKRPGSCNGHGGGPLQPTTNVTPSGGNGGGSTTTTAPACDNTCLGYGQKWLSAIVSFLQLFASGAGFADLVADIGINTALLLKSIALVIAQDWGALAQLVDSALHLVRDVTDFLNTISNTVFGGTLPAFLSPLAGLVHHLSAFLDLVTPFVDWLTSIFQFLLDPLGGIVNNYVKSIDFGKFDMVQQVEDEIARVVFRANVPWLINGLSQALYNNVERFCQSEFSGLCHTKPFW